MKKITIEMPWVSRCEVAKCAYNTRNSCHAKAITIGHGSIPGCDTFLEADRHARTVSLTAGVGACKVTNCRFNDDYECTAESIQVGYQGEEVRCRTFSQR